MMLARSIVWALLAMACLLQTASCRSWLGHRRGGAEALGRELEQEKESGTKQEIVKEPAEYDANVAPESIAVNEGFLQRLSSTLKALVQYFRPRAQASSDSSKKSPAKPAVVVNQVQVLKRYKARMKRKRMKARKPKESLQLYGALSPKFQMGYL